ncbi:RHS repeat-associated core domain-containing protein [Streptomyces sp. B93]|uniref:RHS repeat-associated core domain-containing protein n=1 Tax=Streptomyces sp. B93 TaxID=2824875 RepID=UPI001B35C3F8|nr:RHS repeat-associated core domain-containing protein [Streptomyces sp. B93]MBQ1090009.1 ligand-binding protein [Streptomyces sp. B93]
MKLTHIVTVVAAGTLTASLLTTIDGAAASPVASSRQPVFEKPEPVRSVPVKVVRPDAPAPAGMPTGAPRRAATTWPTPAAATVDLPARTLTDAAALPVRVGPGSRGAPRKVRVEVLPRSRALEKGTDGVALSVTPADRAPDAGQARVRLVVDYSGFQDAHGGNWADRLTLTPLSGPGTAVLSARNDVRARAVTAEVDLARATTFAVTADTGGPTGDYAATSLAPSGSWQTDLSGGGFSWRYDLRVPPVPGGLAPALALSYSSQSVDGRVVAQNSQPSWVGEGWDLWPGYIERAYKPCADDLGGNNGQTKTGDLCWETDNATVASQALSGKLVKGGDGRWRPESDDGTRIERRTDGVNGDKDGQYWILTATDGTRYYYGLNRLPGWTNGDATTRSAWTAPVYGNDTDEPCHAATFAESACVRAYRWNLDYVVDVHGNSMSYFYAPETGKYGQNLGKSTASYTRGGVLSEIHYGTRTGQDYSQVPAKVVLTPADRCVSGTDCAQHTATTWPDVPWDLDCAGAACSDAQRTPSFWTTQRLARITTQVLGADGGYRSVDRWELTHTWPSPGDGTNAGLWLNKVKRTGLGRTTEVPLPAITFTGTMYENRVNSASDGLPKLNKPRMTAIDTESGGRISVTYAPVDCAPGTRPVPETNTRRCFPVRWAMPPAVEPVDDWFHKYVVAQVQEIDNLTGAAPTVTAYEYTGGAAWAWDDNPLVEPARRSWQDWRGYERVVVRTGDPRQDLDHPRLKTAHRYFRGMYGDRLNRAGGTKTPTVTDSTGTSTPDHRQYAGFERESITYLGDTATEVSGEISTPWSRQTATQGVLGTTLRAHQVESVRSVSRVRLADGDDRTTRVDTSYDDYGNVTRVDDHGDTGVTGDEECTTTSYAQNTATHLVSLPRRVVKESVACHSGDPVVPAVLADTRVLYDGHAYDAAPTRGLATRTESAESHSGSTPRYVATTTSYDGYGRALKTTDPLQRSTTTTYTQTKGLTTASTVTNALEHTQTTTLDPAWGLPTTVTDANDRKTSLGYDALGRLRTVYTPGRTAADGAPDLRYGYHVTDSGGPNWVSTDRLVAGGNTTTSYELFDGLLRPRQTQTPSPAAEGGWILTNTTYDSRGLTVRTDEPYYNKSAAGSFYQPPAGSVPGSTVTEFDGAGRVTATLQMAGNEEKWRTTTTHTGDSVTVVPPPGGTATTTVTDARGRVTALRQYHDRTAEGDADTTRYTYTKAGHLKTVTDPAGNVWTYGYDLLGRKTSAHDPDAGTTRTTYDDAGQPLTTTDGRGKTVARVHDDLGRVIETRLGSATGTLLTESEYDTLPGGKGVLTSATSYDHGDAYVTRTDELDDAGRPSRTTVTIPRVTGIEELAGDYPTTYTYKPDGSLSSRTLPALGDLAAETLTHTYTPLGLPHRLTGATTYVDATAYTELGEPSSVVLGPKPAPGQTSRQVTRWLSYDPTTRRLTQQQLTRVVDGSTTARKADYAYDPAGNITSITDHAAGSVADTQCYEYDHLRRVTQVWTQVSGCADTPSTGVVGGPAPYWQTFAHDLTGNRTRKTDKGLGGAADVTTAYHYPAPGPSADQPHTLTSATTGTDDTASYTYDDAGHTLTRPGPDGQQTLEWDDAGQLTGVTSGSGRTSYVHDAAGAPLLRRDPGKATLYVGDGEIVLDTGTGARTGRRYVSGVGTRTRADGLLYLDADHHGTAQVALRATDPASMDVRRLDLFGNPRTGTAGWRGGDRGFVGGTTNTATGLTRLGAREYDPGLGRFLSADPVIDPMDPQQMNGYAYANNNPASMSDPDGLKYFIDADGRYTAPGAAAKKYLGPARYRQILQREDNKARRVYPKKIDTAVPYGPKGLPLPKDVIERTLVPLGYEGSDRFTYRDAFRFAAQGEMQWSVTCQVLGGSPEDCKSSNAPWEFKKAAGWVREWSVSLCASGSLFGAGMEVCGGVDPHGIGYTRAVPVGADAELLRRGGKYAVGDVTRFPVRGGVSVRASNQSYAEQGGLAWEAAAPGVVFSESFDGKGKSVSLPVGLPSRWDFGGGVSETVGAGYLATWDSEAPGFAQWLARMSLACGLASC